MLKTIEVREYKLIPRDFEIAKEELKNNIIKPPLKDWSAATWKAMFTELSEFVSDVRPDDDGDDSHFFLQVVKGGIKARNYVGVIQLKSGCQIQILPKIEFTDENEDKTKDVLLKMLKTFNEFKFKQINRGSLATKRLNIYEIFINIFAEQVEEIVRKGLRSAYITVEDNIPYYKGKLLVNQHIRHNLTHAERFYCAYDEFHVNRPENRLLKSTLLKLQRISSDFQNQKKLRQLLVYFELVEPSLNYEADFSRIVIDRNTRAYEMPLKWAEVFLLGKSFTNFTGKTDAVSLLFPMEKMFESYVARLAEISSVLQKNWDVTKQEGSHFLFTEPKKRFNLRPDIVLRQKDKSKTIIVDTKWKRLTNDENKNYGISQADMYQMYAYAREFETPYVCLIYPKNKEVSTSEDNIVEVAVYKNSHKMVEIHILMADLGDDDNLNNLFKYIAKIGEN